MAGNLAERAADSKSSAALSGLDVLTSAVRARLADSRRYLSDKPDALLHGQRRQAALDLLKGKRPRSVLFVCHGNICRSPFAAARFASVLPPEIAQHMRIESSGFIGPGRCSPPAALAAAARRGVDLSLHRSTILTANALWNSDLIVVVSGDQARALRPRIRPGSHLLVLGDLDPLPIRRRTILDPWRGDSSTFEASYERIDRCVRELAQGLSSPGALQRDGASRIRHHFTVDVEEYFQVAALDGYVARSEWDSIPARVQVGVNQLLDLLDEYHAQGTFFVLSWIAERHPELIREIASRGHEIASHGTDHRRVSELDPSEFRMSVRDSKRILEDVTGAEVHGYRAPSFSIVRGREWALDILAEEGYSYDSSLFPVRRRGYGFEGGQRDPHRLALPGHSLFEFPPATLKLGGLTIPAGGGAYLRHLPYTLIHSALAAAEKRGTAATFYIHPWELDPDQPRIDVALKTRLRHYGGIHRTAPRIRKLLSSFQFQPIARGLGLDSKATVPPPLRSELTDAVPVRV